MRRASALLLALALAGVSAACGGDNATNNAGGANSNATRNGVVETNANVPPNMNNKTAPSNTATVQNNNGNENTAGVSTTNNSNGGHTNSNGGH
ncbi:MAG TPA: hypothetical protein VGC87_25690 [Pyrinomonadaceae bacterium]